MRYSDILESYLIPAEEGAWLNELKDTAKSQIKEAGKEILPMFSAFAIMCAALGIYSKYKDYKDKKDRQAKTNASNEAHERAMKEAFTKIDSKYKFSSMTKNEYRAFTAKMDDQIEDDIRKLLKPLNSKDILNKIKEEYIKKLHHWYDDDSKTLREEIAEANKIFKPGLFKLVENGGDYICIINGDQDVCSSCYGFGINDDVAEALELKYSDFVNAGLFGVGTGDGDEGCVYPEFVTYETMRKRI